MYYNLCVTSVRDKDWENVVKYGNLNISIVAKYQNRSSHPNLFLMIGNAYLNLNKIVETKKILSQVKNTDIFKSNDDKVLFNYYELLANVATVEKKFESAGIYYKKALIFSSDCTMAC